MPTLFNIRTGSAKRNCLGNPGCKMGARESASRKTAKAGRQAKTASRKRAIEALMDNENSGFQGNSSLYANTRFQNSKASPFKNDVGNDLPIIETRHRSCMRSE